MTSLTKILTKIATEESLKVRNFLKILIYNYIGLKILINQLLSYFKDFHLRTYAVLLTESCAKFYVMVSFYVNIWA